MVAPSTCIGCGVEGEVLCQLCLVSAGEPPVPRCVGCKRLTEDYATCRSCRNWINIHSVYVTTSYEGMYEQLIRSFKFDVKRQAVDPIASIMVQASPPLAEPELILCPLPTAPARIRQRGFDHAKLLARAYWRKLPEENRQKLTIDHTLNRKSNTRQLGSDRAQRIAQVKDEFFVKNPLSVKGKTFLLLDDVTTTGASLAAAAKTLKNAGAKRIYAVVFAQKS